MVLKEQLATDRALRPLVAQFVPINIEQGTPESSQWRRQYKDDSNTIPILHVVRADGQQLFGGAAPLGPELPKLLIEQLARSGKVLPARQLEQLAAAHQQAVELEAAGDLSAAIERLARVGSTGSYARPAVEVQKMIDRLTEQAQQAIAQAEEKLATASQALDGALALVETQRVYGRLPEIGKALSLKLSGYRRERQLRDTFVQADLLDKAQALEARPTSKPARDAYQQIITRYPGTPAAELAAARIEALP